MPAQATFKTDIAMLLADKDHASLKTKLAQWRPADAASMRDALVGIVLWGSLMGSMLPLFLKRLGFAPATSSAPFVAALVDGTGLIICFTVALAIMP